MSERKAPAPSVRISGGTPAGFSDFVPLNPWGREVPKPAPRRKPVLSQLVVRDLSRGGQETRVGPAVDDPMIPDTLCMAIQQQIALGREKRWADPVVVTFTAEIGRLPTSLF